MKNIVFILGAGASCPFGFTCDMSVLPARLSAKPMVGRCLCDVVRRVYYGNSMGENDTAKV